MEVAEARIDDKHAVLVGAAARVLRRVGFERMRLRDVATEAGVSIGLLQHYFETREQLGREAFAAACGQRAADFAASAEGVEDSRERIERMLRHAFEPALIADRAGSWLELCAAASRDPLLRAEAAAVQAAWREPMLEAIRAGQRDGELSADLDPERAADLLLALVDGAEIASALGESSERLLPGVDAVLELVLGVRTEGRPG